MPPATQARRYLWTFVSFTTGAILVVAALNLVADPFRVFGTPRCGGLNDRIPNTSGFDRMAKPYEIRRLQPQTVILGSSTAHSGFISVSDWNTELPKPIYNYALLGASFHEVFASLAHALRECPIKDAIIVTDFFAFNAYYHNNSRFDPERLLVGQHTGWPHFRGPDLAAFLIGRGTLALSWKTLTESRRDLAIDAASPWGRAYPWREKFRSMERFYLGMWLPPPEHEYAFASANGGNDRFADFDAMLRLASEREIRLIILCPPIHARFQEAIAAAGVWPHYEAWKRGLAVRTRAQQDNELGRGIVELWDFSIITEATSEAVPKDGGTPMRYFYDSAHFTPDLGALVLDEILNEGAPSARRLGVRLDQVGVEDHLAQVRSSLGEFRTQYPEVVSDVRSGLRSTEITEQSRFQSH